MARILVIDDDDQFRACIRSCLERAGYRCEMSGAKHAILDPHHILPKSVYPQYYLEPMNIVLLSRLDWHTMAEDHPEEFWQEMLKRDKLADRVAWVEERRGINKYCINPDYNDQLRRLIEFRDNNDFLIG